MSGDAVCLRCDWRGTTDAAGDPCPSCGVPLFLQRPESPVAPEGDASAATPAAAPAPRGGPAPGPSPVPPSGATARSATAPAPEAAGSSVEAPSERERADPRRVIAVVLVPAVVVLAIGLVFSRPGEGLPAANRAADPSSLPGYALYSSDDDPERSGLFLLDLATGETSAAQPIPDVVDLVRVDDDLSSFGVTRVAEDGSLIAFLLSGLSPNARGFPVTGGDIITWGTEGLSIVSVQTGPDVRCRRRVRADVVQLAGAPRRSVVYAKPRLCGDVLAAGHDGNRAYLSIARGEVVRTSWTSPAGVLHRAVPNRTFSSVSPTGDMIVTPVRFISPGLLPGSRRDPGPIPQLAGPSELAWPGRGGPAPIVDAEGRPIQVQRTLAWAPDGSEALVVGGPLDRAASIYELPASVAEGDRVAREVWPVDGPIGGASPVDDGSWLLVMDRQLIRVTDGHLERVGLDEAAPEPTGPVLWLPTVP